MYVYIYIYIYRYVRRDVHGSINIIIIDPAPVDDCGRPHNISIMMVLTQVLVLVIVKVTIILHMREATSV